MMWQYLVAYYSGEWTFRPEAPTDALKVDPKSSMQQGCTVLGQHGWELVGVTVDSDLDVWNYTLFFKKPA